jgi:S1-C subfamily serine protease
VPYATILPSNLKRLRKEFRRDEKFSSTVLADFFWVTEGSTLKKTRLGVIAEESFAGEDGVVVRRVTGGSSADKAGIEAGDTIVALDGETITDMVDLRVALYGKEPGTVSRLVFVREGEERETAVTFSEIKAH